MFGGFLREESGQGAIEYILLAGATVVVGIVIFTIYSQMVETSGGRLNQSTGNATSKMSSLINDSIDGMG